jgi:hypothetical protein
MAFATVMFSCRGFIHAMWDYHATWHWKQKHLSTSCCASVLAVEKRSIYRFSRDLPRGALTHVLAVFVRPLSFSSPQKMESSSLIWVYLPPCELPIASQILRVVYDRHREWLDRYWNSSLRSSNPCEEFRLRGDCIIIAFLSHHQASDYLLEDLVLHSRCSYSL